MERHTYPSRWNLATLREYADANGIYVHPFALRKQYYNAVTNHMREEKVRKRREEKERKRVERLRARLNREFNKIVKKNDNKLKIIEDKEKYRGYYNFSKTKLKSKINKESIVLGVSSDGSNYTKQDYLDAIFNHYSNKPYLQISEQKHRNTIIKLDVIIPEINSNKKDPGRCLRSAESLFLSKVKEYLSQENFKIQLSIEVIFFKIKKVLTETIREYMVTRSLKTGTVLKIDFCSYAYQTKEKIITF